MQAMNRDRGEDSVTLRVDGGMVENNWFLQFLASLLNVPVERPQTIETTALGAAYLAGLKLGIYQSLEDICSHWQKDAAFTPQLQEEQRNQLLSGWGKAVSRVLEAQGQ